MTVSKMGPMARGTPWGDLLGSFANFTYFPYTDWTRMWEQFYSPRFYFGCNVADAETEREVLDAVGSYGSQLNVVLDAMVVFLQRVEPKTLTEDERARIRALVDLMDRADRAAAQAGHKKVQMLAMELAPWVQGQVRGQASQPGTELATGPTTGTTSGPATSSGTQSP